MRLRGHLFVPYPHWVGSPHTVAGRTRRKAWMRLLFSGKGFVLAWLADAIAGC
jgi:hypothetical protein